MFFEQIKHKGSNFSYVIADESTREAVVVDPSFNADAIIRTIEKENLDLKYIINTHHHGDHTSDNMRIKSLFKAKIVAHKLAPTKKDVTVDEADSLKVGGITFRIIHTPGHTPDGICILFDGKLLTGDTLFVGECGRTDLSGSSAEDMYRSLFGKIAKLDDNVEVYPGHDYGSKPQSTVGLEKRTNYTLKERSIGDFIEFMRQP